MNNPIWISSLLIKLTGFSLLHSLFYYLHLRSTNESFDLIRKIMFLINFNNKILKHGWNFSDNMILCVGDFLEMKSLCCKVVLINLLDLMFYMVERIHEYLQFLMVVQGKINSFEPLSNKFKFWRAHITYEKVIQQIKAYIN